MEQQARERAEAEQAEYQRKLEEYQSRGAGGHEPQPPMQTPADKDQVNLTDSDSNQPESESANHLDFERDCDPRAALDL